MKQRRECIWALNSMGNADASCGLTYNESSSVEDMLDPEYTGKDDSMQFCYHCGGKIIIGKKIVVKGKIKIIK